MANNTKRPSLATQRQLNESNAERLTQLGLGRLVVVARDDGSRETRMLTALPWQLGHGQWVCGLEGIGGGYCCGRVQPIKEVRA